MPTKSALAAALLATATAAFAQDTMNTTQRLDAFRQLDADGDGRLTKAEAAKRAEVRAGFDKADANHDGHLTFAEFETLALKPAGGRTPERR